LSFTNTKLQALKLANLKLNDEDLSAIFQQSPNLTSLDINGNFFITQKGLQKLPTHKLKELSADSSMFITPDLNFDVTLLNKFPSLTKLALSYESIYAVCIDRLFTFSQLTELDLYGRHEITQALTFEYLDPAEFAISQAWFLLICLQIIHNMSARYSQGLDGSASQQSDKPSFWRTSAPTILFQQAKEICEDSASKLEQANNPAQPAREIQIFSKYQKVSSRYQRAKSEDKPSKQPSSQCLVM
jgi:hypothetical protein